MKTLDSFAGQNWLITPAALAVNEQQPANISAQKWLLVLSGVVRSDIMGNSQSQWFPETVNFRPDMAGPLNYAINRFSIPRPSGPAGSFYTGFAVEEWSPFAAPSSMFNQGQSLNSGFAVDTWRPSPFASGTDALSNRPVSQVFTGITVDVAVRDTDAILHRISYNITLLGRIVFPLIIIT